ncbi:dTDP-4-dehydrorhamnose 3,5-epimerase [Chlamydiales bacterium SCGC AB-751-O23]|jgi:dTDP-4-dehydrorhamnose 3,5-epimerase|nr:dTDP-4-dehydrorhamnose 3,5-epimerase [Chlamydiales bacterium SCGC AB-751-O23]
MHTTDLALPGLKLIEPKVFLDDRGHFFETFHQPRFEEAGVTCNFVQDNHSLSSKGTLRGMHFQNTPGQDKLISVLNGEIFDCVVDMRSDSPTFKKWYAVILNDQNHRQLFIPKGFAHGFCVLSEKAHVIYKVSNIYNPETEKGFRYDDPEIGIQWPTDKITLSSRDQNTTSFSEAMQCYSQKETV